MTARKVLVTGGTQGIGRATAEALVEAGYEVIVSGRAPNGKVAKNCAYLSCDFSNLSALETFASEIAKLDLAVLINNAGINKVGPLTEYDPTDFSRIQQVNVTAPFLLCRAVVPGMCKRGFGRIVNITSVFGIVSRVGRSAYSTSKFALFGLSRALALEVAPYNVLVNCVAPGFVDTDMTHRTLGEKGIAETINLIPMGRLARPQEISHYVRFLVSEENSYMTGQCIVVDGGFTSE